jgi:hypothetical protein
MFPEPITILFSFVASFKHRTHDLGQDNFLEALTLIMFLGIFQKSPLFKLSILTYL